MKKNKKTKTKIEEPKVIKTKKKVKKIKKNLEIVAPSIVASQPLETKIRPEIISFYGHEIRNTFMNNQWYFSLEDILKVASVVDPTKFLIELKSLDTLKVRYYQLIETFSYYEGTNPIIIPVVNFQNFMEILPSVRSKEYFMPGPFPDWLKDMANRKF